MSICSIKDCVVRATGETSRKIFGAMFFVAATIRTDAAPKPGTVEFTPVGGVYTNFVVLALSSSNALVRYTTDGTEPTEKSPSYSEPLLLRESTFLSARTFPRRQPPGAVFTQHYVIHEEPITDFSSTLPLIIVDTLGQPTDVPVRYGATSPPPVRPKLPAVVTILTPTNGRSTLLETPEHHGWASVNIRGGSTSALQKKPFKLELQDEAGNDLKAGLLGLPRESDWILLASYHDSTFVRDVLAYELWRQLGYYAPRWRYVEVFVKTNRSENAVRSGAGAAGTNRRTLPSFELPGWGNYAGLYILVEKIKRGRHRLDIEKLRPEDSKEPEISGGYIFKKDRVNVGESGFETSQGVRFAFEEPKEREITASQRTWLTNYVNEFERALFGKDFRDPTNGYAKYIDVASFIDYHWMLEVARDMDGYLLSQFYSKDRGGKLKMGPMWDLDMAFGNSTYLKGYRTYGWRFEQVPEVSYKWFARLFEDPDFLQRYIDRWSELRTTVFATTNLLALVDALVTDPLKEAQQRNSRRWPNFEAPIDPAVDRGKTYRSEVNWLKRWITGRLSWIESQDFPPPKAQVVESPAGSTTVTLSCAVGRVFYTTDGSDPRADGGGIASKAKEYGGPIILPHGARLTARARSEYALWSAPVKVDGNASNN